MQGVKGIKIQRNTFTDNTLLPLNNHCNGIEAYDASFKCTMLNDVFNKYNNLYYGIKALYTNPILAPTIKYDRFINCYRGIYISGNTGAIIYRTYMKMPHDNNQCYGLYLDNSTGYQVEYNGFLQMDNNIQGDIGLIVNNSHKQLNSIYLNTFTNFNYGILAQNDNRGSDNNTGLKIKCNTFSQNLHDIAVTRDGSSNYVGISNYQGYYDINIPSSPASNQFSFGDRSEEYFNDDVCLHFTYYYNTFIPTPYEPAKNLVPRDGHYTANTITLSNTGLRYTDMSCPPSVSEGDLIELYSIMDSAQTEVSSSAIQLRQLVDAGNTTALNSQVELSQPPQALQLRNELLGISPYLSDSVMISAITNEDALPPLMLKQVLVANPQSPKSERLMETLLNRNNPLPDYMITEIEAGKNLVSAKENLEAKIAYYYQEKELAYNEIMRRYKNDTVHNWASDSILALLGRTPTSWAKYYLTFDKLYLADYLTAGQLLNNIPLAINLDAEEQNNYNDYYDYMQVLIQLQQDSSNIYNLKERQRQTLNTLAWKGNNYANAYARNLLIMADSIPYNEPIILPDVPNKSLHKPNKPFNNKGTDMMLKVFPNPAKDYFTVEYKLSETAGSAVVEIVDLTGKKLRVLPIYDKQNQLIIETKELQTGIYYIRLLVNGATSNIQKISVNK
jgi:hypothetical protein